MMMLRKLPTVVLALLLPWQLAAAAPRAKPQENPWAVILGSKPQPAEVQALLESMQKSKALQWLEPAEGFPKAVESASLPGLAPGLHVLVLGVCGSKEKALAARARVLPMMRDAYVKQLTGPTPLSCPTTSTPLKARLPKNAARVASVPFQQDKALALSVYRVNERSVMECKTNDLLFRLEYGREVIAQETLQGDCRGVCTEYEKQQGEERLAKLRERIEKEEASESQLDYNFVDCQPFTPAFVGVLGGFDRPLLFVSTAHLAHHGVVTTSIQAVGVACGTITMPQGYYDPGTPSPYAGYFTQAEARRSTREGADEDSFDIVVREQAPGAENGAAPVWKRVAGLHYLGCDWELSTEP